MFYSCLIYTVLSVAVYPKLLFLLAANLLFIFLILKFAMRSCIEALRLDAISRSPINSLFSATLQNLITIRAYNREEAISREFESLVDQNGRAFFTYLAVARGMGLWIETLGALWISGIILASYFTVIQDVADASDNALAITSSLVFLGCFQYLVKLFSDIQSSMSSIERMQSYSQLEIEKEYPSDDHSKWPQEGSIRFNKATLRYRADFEPVLRDIDFEVLSGMQVGIVGRTGAGKSSLIQALFRLVECDRPESIQIDEISTSKIPLSTLRRAISIIPQSPFIFEGTVRENLDPFSQYSD